MSGVCVDGSHVGSVFGGWCTVCQAGYVGPDEFVAGPDPEPALCGVLVPGTFVTGCQLSVGHSGAHRVGGYAWSLSGDESSVPAASQVPAVDSSAVDVVVQAREAVAWLDGQSQDGPLCVDCGDAYAGVDTELVEGLIAEVERLRAVPVPNPPAPGRNGRWELLGEVGVDSASVAVTDLLDEADVSSSPPYWSDKVGAPDSHYATPGSKWAGDYGTGIRLWAGFGDGGYRVWGWIVDYGEDGVVDERLAQVVVTFIDQAELDEWRQS